MNVASLELCKELDELTQYKWMRDTDYRWYCLPKLIHKGSSPEQDFSSWQVKHVSYRGQYRVDWHAAYDSGYLLRKLPNVNLFRNVKRNEWEASAPARSRTRHEYADTPEDALCKLAIELIKQGVIQV